MNNFDLVDFLFNKTFKRTVHEYNPPEIFFSSGIAKLKGLKNEECRFDIASKLAEYANIPHGPYAIHKHT